MYVEMVNVVKPKIQPSNAVKIKNRLSRVRQIIENRKKIFVPAIFMLFMFLGIAAGSILVQNPQDLRRKAAGPILPTFLPEETQGPLVISTRSLSGKSQQFYSSIDGYSANGLDELKMDIKNLPLGMSVVDCKSKIVSDRKYIICTLKGENIKIGLYRIDVTLSDGKGGSINKQVPVTISN